MTNASALRRSSAFLTRVDSDAAAAFAAHGPWIAGETLAESVEPGEDWLVRRA